MRQLFQVYINHKHYWVYDIPEKVCEPQNGEPATWWVYFTDNQLPEGTTPPIDSDEWVEYSNSINRLVWDISFKEQNTTKYKWDNWRFRKSCVCQMSCNGKLVYEFHVREIEFAMSKCSTLMVELVEHMYNFLDPESQKGRKIWWQGLPATIQPRESMPWEINIYPDLTDKYPTLDLWFDEYEKRQIPPFHDDDSEMDKEEISDFRASGVINWGNALSDQYINWFRK